jgi:ribosomal protein L40E
MDTKLKATFVGKGKEEKMAFKKTGDVPVEKILCNCGARLAGVAAKCPKCGKTLIPENLQTPTTPPVDGNKT